MDHPKPARRLTPTPEESRKLDKEWADSFTDNCENRLLLILRRMSLAQKEALFAESQWPRRPCDAENEMTYIAGEIPALNLGAGGETESRPWQ